ncbi:MAG: hypothetical protein JW783_08360 [Bacteroidales bacterium]|nr:hypothetical protein [Bacteroidales bacterium]MBN2749954.1 hypothetical protein [Bacteroidales bacterium]
MPLYDPKLSRFKLWVSLKGNDAKNEIFYSFIKEDEKGDTASINGIVRRLIEGKLKNKYITAILYWNNPKREGIIHKWVMGKLEQ